jgi:Amt family ammonium transporter
VSGLKHMFSYDDALDAFGVHAVGGAVGAILTGVFAVEKIGQTAGLIEGNSGQVINQIEGVALVLAYDIIVSLIILKLIDWTIGLRVPKEVETEGLDITLHGEVVQ